MQLHHLSLVAFGPFTDAVEVDFDALGSHGLFLLTGATGAGKTSILDAVAFALYGNVPGDRGGARHLRNDMAEPFARPLVRLEFTVAGHRLLVERTPAWTRPKKRGIGDTTEHASVRLLQREGQAWRVLTTRHEEALGVITDRLGMNLRQFTQVVLLPQGDFQAFLRADSDTRLRLLQRLFRTGRHEEVEAWLRDRRLDLGRTDDAMARSVRERISRVAEAAQHAGGEHLPDDIDEIGRWALTLRQDRAELAATLAGVHAALEAEATAAQEQARWSDELHARQERVRHALARREQLVRAEGQVEALRGTIAATRALHGLLPLRSRVTRAVEERSSAFADRDQALTLLAQAHPRLSEAATAQSGTAAGAELLAELTAVLESAARCAEDEAAAQGELQTLDDQLERLEPQLESVAAALVDLPARRDQLREATLVAQRATAALTGLNDRVSAAEQVAQAARLAELLEPQVAQAHQVATEHRDDLLQHKEVWLDLREQRLHGMAGELAAQLSAGCSCPVCGSDSHPAPATAGDSRVTAEDERRARASVDTAESLVQAAQAHLNELRTRLDVARDQAVGTTVLEAEAHLRTQQEERHRCARQAEAWEELDRQLRECEAQAEALQADHVTARDARDKARAARETAGQVHARARAAWESCRARLVDLVALDASEAERAGAEAVLRLARGQCTALERRLEGAVRSRDHAQAAAGQAAERLEALVEAAAASGLDLPALGTPEAELEALALLDARLAATVGEEELARAEEAVTRHDGAHEQVRLVLEDPDHAAAAQAPPADPVDAERRREAARRLAESVHVRAAHAARAAQRVRALTDELEVELAAWAPLRASHALVQELSRLAEGTSPDNRPQMRLTTYVLQHRFAAVIAAANVRLAPMSDQRYELVQSGTRLAGERRGGLSLVVADAWSGVARDPATLSGGETFVVSLALALGLADVVMAEAGGTELETLFVDEGFGALDAETLDDVMDVLDGLRSGGRRVGVVSHVPEMRDRIPSQLEVRKQRQGSTVHPRIG